MPGVVVTTAIRRGARNTVNNATSSFFVVGDAQRGPVESVQTVTSLEQFEAIFGDYVSHAYLWQTLQVFFEEGGATAHIVRVAPSNADTAALSLFAPVDSTPTAVVTVSAVGPGAWANTALKGKVVTSGSGVKFELYVDGATSPVAATGTVTTAAEIVAAINANTTLALFVTAALIDTDYADAVMSTTASLQDFEDGLNGTGAPAAADIVSALDLFLDTFGGGAVAAPGYSSETVNAGLIQHANAYNRFALMAAGDDETTATEALDFVTDLDLAATENMEHGAMYYPWVTIPYGTGSITCPPEGYVAGVRARVHTGAGQWQPYAGALSAALFVNGVATSLGRTQNNTLDAGRVNAIRIINNTVRIYGARSLAADTENFKYVSIQETTNRIVIEAQNALEDLVFSPIDGRRAIYGRIKASLMGIMEPLRSAGALFAGTDATGQPTDSGYYIVVDDTINPLTQLATGVVRARIAFRMSGVTDTIQLEIVKSNLTTPIS